MINKILLSITLLLTFSSCVNQVESYSKKTPEQIAKEVKIEDSEFEDKIKYNAPDINIYDKVNRSQDITSMLVPVGDTIYSLRGWQNRKSKKLEHQIMILDKDSDWRYFNGASDETAKNLDLVKIDSDVNCNTSSYSYQVNCNHWETVGINLSDKYLKSKQEKGLKIKVKARSGSHRVIEIPSNYIKGYLLAIKNHNKK